MAAPKVGPKVAQLADHSVGQKAVSWADSSADPWAALLAARKVASWVDLMAAKSAAVTVAPMAGHSVDARAGHLECLSAATSAVKWAAWTVDTSVGQLVAHWAGQKGQHSVEKLAECLAGSSVERMERRSVVRSAARLAEKRAGATAVSWAAMSAECSGQQMVGQ